MTGAWGTSTFFRNRGTRGGWAPEPAGRRGYRKNPPPLSVIEPRSPSPLPATVLTELPGWQLRLLQRDKTIQMWCKSRKIQICCKEKEIKKPEKKNIKDNRVRCKTESVGMPYRRAVGSRPMEALWVSVFAPRNLPFLPQIFKRVFL
jgi:hypothetical protein